MLSNFKIYLSPYISWFASSFAISKLRGLIETQLQPWLCSDTDTNISLKLTRTYPLNWSSLLTLACLSCRNTWQVGPCHVSAGRMTAATAFICRRAGAYKPAPAGGPSAPRQASGLKEDIEITVNSLPVDDSWRRSFCVETPKTWGSRSCGG